MIAFYYQTIKMIYLFRFQTFNLENLLKITKMNKKTNIFQNWNSSDENFSFHLGISL